MPNKQSQLSAMLDRGNGFAITIPLPPVADALTPALQADARTYIGARQRMGDSLLEACRALAGARQKAAHGEWSIFLETIGIDESRARAQLRIHDEVQSNAQFAEHMRTGFLSEAVARELLPLPADARQAIMESPTPPTRADVRNAKRAPAPVLPAIPPALSMRARQLGLTITPLAAGGYSLISASGVAIGNAPDPAGVAIMLGNHEAAAERLNAATTHAEIAVLRDRVEALGGTLGGTPDERGCYTVIPPAGHPRKTMTLRLDDLAAIVDSWEQFPPAEGAPPAPTLAELGAEIAEFRRRESVAPLSAEQLAAIDAPPAADGAPMLQGAPHEQGGYYQRPATTPPAFGDLRADAAAVRDRVLALGGAWVGAGGRVLGGTAYTITLPDPAGGADHVLLGTLAELRQVLGDRERADAERTTTIADATTAPIEDMPRREYLWESFLHASESGDDRRIGCAALVLAAEHLAIPVNTLLEVLEPLIDNTAWDMLIAGAS